jgi:mono/diheme cytochrome c family protein
MTRVRMTSIVSLTLTLSLLSVSCSRKNASSTEQELMKDSPALVDSSGHVALPQTEALPSYEQRQGKDLYIKYCAICHGKEGTGDGFNAFNLDPRPRNFTDATYMDALSDNRLVETISQGGRGVNRSLLMPSWGGRLNRQEIEYVVSFVRSFNKPHK